MIDLYEKKMSLSQAKQRSMFLLCVCVCVCVCGLVSEVGLWSESH